MHIESHLDVDVIAHESQDSVTCMLQLKAPTAASADNRLGQTLVVVLDRSGSMSGDPLDSAKAALQSLIHRLAPKDRFGVVVFDDAAQVIVPIRQMRDHNLPELSARLDAVTTGGCTNLYAGYSLARRELRRVLATPTSDLADAATIMLISDGHANSGNTDPAQLRRVAQRAHQRHAISSVTIGLGLGYDELLLAEIAGGGSGNHLFAAGADDLPAAIAGEVDGLLDKSVLAATIRVTGRDGLLSQVDVPQELPAWVDGDATVIAVGDLYSGEERTVLVRLHTEPLAALGLATIADLTVEFTALPAQAEHTVSLPISVNVVPGDVAAKRIPAPAVVVEELLAETTKAKTSASANLRSGDSDAARTELTRSSRRLDSLSRALDVLRKHGQLDADTSARLRRTLGSERHTVDGLTADIDTMPSAYSSKRSMSSAAAGRSRRSSTTLSGLECPECGAEALPIMWGMPASDPGPGVIMGGCCLPGELTTHGCKACGWRGVL